MYSNANYRHPESMFILVLVLSVVAIGWSARLVLADGIGAVAPPRSNLHETGVVRDQDLHSAVAR